MYNRWRIRLTKEVSSLKRQRHLEPDPPMKAGTGRFYVPCRWSCPCSSLFSHDTSHHHKENPSQLRDFLLASSNVGKRRRIPPEFI
jgi:hypothetical protein